MMSTPPPGAKPTMMRTGRDFRLLPNPRGTDCSPPLGPPATARCPLAPRENTTASASGTHRTGSPGGAAQHGRQWPWTLASRPEQSPLRGTLQCPLQIARSPLLVWRVLAQLLDPPCTDPYARWCGRGGAARLPPIPILGPTRHFAAAQQVSRLRSNTAIRNSSQRFVQ